MEEFIIRNAKQNDLSIILSLFTEAYRENYIYHGEIQLGIADNKNSLNPDGLIIKKKNWKPCWILQNPL